MFFKILVVLSLLAVLAYAHETSFVYNGFRSAKLSLDGIAGVTPNGLLKLTNHTKQQKGHAFHPDPVRFKNSPNGSVFSFSTTFVFAIQPQYATLSGHGIVFVVAPQRSLPGSRGNQYLGMFNETDNGNNTNHVFGVELDTILNSELQDINNNHVGIDLNGLPSAKSTPAGYYADGGEFKNLTLISGKAMQVWVDYDGTEKQINVTLAPINVQKPQTPLLSLSQGLSSIINQSMYVGFSSSTGSFLTSHYVLGWSFRVNGEAQALARSQLPKLPRIGKKETSKVLTIGLPLMAIFVVSMLILSVVYVIKRKRKFAEVLEDWERGYGPHRFKFKDLYIATKGFWEQELLGTGGFGRVYRGILPTSKIEIAVKRVSHESRQGMREFVAEIISIGRLRHRNIVSLLGYCRRKGELLLVYDYMPNGSLDKYLYNQPKVTLNWRQRFRVIKGVASGLLYLHEGWEQVVIHRDIKASNILLDADLNGRLGDFGLARLYDHGTDPQTTHVVGTLGYLAPEHTRTGKATRNTDVYAFGAFLLEVACGRRPIELREAEDVLLVDWVFSCWVGGAIVEARDPKLGAEFVEEEMELVLKLGLTCSHANPLMRPSMRQVLQYLEGDLPMPELSSIGLSSSGLTFAHREGFDDLAMAYPSSMYKASARSSSVAESLLSGGR
ncbi:L-type lectin-domain containing receptor kinase IV.1-like isoform X1 [Syzygium oleosum]|uniref:L-type lectin-domain containing receptor kinase IV.1-like isoform X1 n=1 Tax=Syzygium oleosum TaxID=219896 RepID=UPI0024BB19C2|nr:L-type lectin-domain containing receptor kinase IV.1-like isoform X1 [Syzygium oleosum]